MCKCEERPPFLVPWLGGLSKPLVQELRLHLARLLEQLARVVEQPEVPRGQLSRPYIGSILDESRQFRTPYRQVTNHNLVQIHIICDGIRRRHWHPPYTHGEYVPSRQIIR